MALRVKVLAVKPDEPRLALGSTGWKERIKSCNDFYRQDVE